jgi:head-tail adaptor
MAAGPKREVIIIDAEQAQADGDEIEPLWTEIARMRAEVTPVRASETEREGALRTIQVYLFAVHAAAHRAANVTSAHRIRWGGRIFNIRETRVGMTNSMDVEYVAETGVTI